VGNLARCNALLQFTVWNARLRRLAEHVVQPDDESEDYKEVHQRETRTRSAHVGRSAATTVPLSVSVYEQAVRSQRVRVLPEGDGAVLVAPVTNRGDVIGVLELRLPERPDADTVEQIAAAAHVLGYVVIANDRFTDLFEWGQRSAPMSLEGEIQRRLLPSALTCEAGPFTIAGALEPAGQVGGDTFDYSLERETLHVSLTDAMGHGTDAALLATLLVGSLRNSRRSGASILAQAATANAVLAEHSADGTFVTGQLLRVSLATGTAEIVNSGHPHPLRLRDGRVETIELDADLPFGMLADTCFRAQSLTLEPGDRLVLVTDGLFERNPVHVDIPDLVAKSSDLHPREVVQRLTRSFARAAGGDMRADATAL
jgi:serine phosphatase RsbU (regulator of sigma subunit)